jgi:hypothetical protein
MELETEAPFGNKGSWQISSDNRTGGSSPPLSATLIVAGITRPEFKCNSLSKGVIYLWTTASQAVPSGILDELQAA